MQAAAMRAAPQPERRRGGSGGGRGRGGGRGSGRGGRGRRRRNRTPSADSSSSPASSASSLPQLSFDSASALPPTPAPAPATPAGARRSRRPRSSTLNPRAAPFAAPGPTELSKRLASQVARGHVECVVCLERVRRDRPFWSCDVCYVITHLHCARKWGSQSTSDSDGLPSTFNCPSCRSPVGDPRKLQFRCYCRRRKNPQLEPGLTPGSCGEPCRKPRGAPGSGCPHRCTELCHPGPCAPCVVPVPPVKCFCGREQVFRRCGDEMPLEGVSCGGVCGKVHSDCGHKCEKKCHAAGEVGECEVIVDTLCYCGKTTAQLPCAVASLGYSCGEPCDAELDCGNHRCRRSCHEGPCAPCETSPEVVKTCACGKTLLSKAQRASRTSCLDPIPGCGQKCGKTLGCLQGHKCEYECGHDGECGPCEQEVTVECRCASTTKKVKCGERLDELRRLLVCDRKCNDRLLCRRHNCQSICCPYKKRKALSRPNVISSDKAWSDSPEVAHLYNLSNSERRRLGHGCSDTCDRILQCGLHKCDLACGHNGDCPPCGILVREPLRCACGEEEIPAPVRCGTFPPTCNRPCSKTRDCGHKCPMNCHPGDCDPCVELVSFPCIGGHGERRYAPCHIGLKGLKCHRPCGKPLRCGVHACAKPCHGDYPTGCEHSTEDGCAQVCGLPLKKCDHVCRNSCHPGMLCPDTPCHEIILVRCPCGRREERSLCLRGGMGGSQGHNDNVRLKCDDECAAQSRLRAFASAVGRDRASGLIGGSMSDSEEVIKYPGFLLQFAEREPVVVQYLEGEYSRVVLGKARKIVLEGLPDLHRLVAHHLAEYYCLETESEGRQPHRRLVARHKGAGLKPVFPNPLLSEALAMREREKKRTRQLESGRTIVIHVAGSTAYPATARIEARVEAQLRSHAGSYRIIGRSAMSSNLTGVTVEFSTSERAQHARISLLARTGVAVETPASQKIIEAANSKPQRPHSLLFAAAESQWNEGVRFGQGIQMRNGLPAPPPEVLVDENVPDSWDD